MAKDIILSELIDDFNAEKKRIAKVKSRNRDEIREF